MIQAIRKSWRASINNLPENIRNLPAAPFN